MSIGNIVDFNKRRMKKKSSLTFSKIYKYLNSLVLYINSTFFFLSYLLCPCLRFFHSTLFRVNVFYY
jgi:hypothetical protein